MREDWKYERLLDACDVYQPATISTKQLVENGEFDVFGANGKIGKYSSYNHEEPEVLLTCRGATCGNINVSTPKSWINGNAMVVHPKEKNLLKNYLVYLLKTLNYTEVITGSAQPQITRLSLKNVYIPVPPLPEQERIVSLLDAEFAKIDALKANAASQLQAAKDLFQAALKQLLTPQKGWEKKKLGECFISINNGANIKQTKGAGGIPITRIETLSNGVFNKDRLGYANIDDASRYYKYILKDGDLLMSHINSVEFVGRTVVFHNQLPIVIHGMNLLRLVPNTTAISDFYYYAFKTPWFRLQLEPIIHKSVNQASMNTTALKQVNVYIPNKDTQQEIVSRLDKISEKVKALQANYDQTINLCNDLKQSLLKSIFE